VNERCCHGLEPRMTYESVLCNRWTASWRTHAKPFGAPYDTTATEPKHTPPEFDFRTPRSRAGSVPRMPDQCRPIPPPRHEAVKFLDRSLGVNSGTRLGSVTSPCRTTACPATQATWPHPKEGRASTHVPGLAKDEGTAPFFTERVTSPSPGSRCKCGTVRAGAPKWVHLLQ